MMSVRIPNPKKSVYPTWVCRARWAATALNILVIAKNEEEAYDKACKRILRAEGGIRCLGVEVLRGVD